MLPIIKKGRAKTVPQDIYIYNAGMPVPKNVQHVEIPKGITHIRREAFRDHTRLQSVVIPDSVTEIMERAFEGCSGLQSVTIPDSVTEIGAYAFRSCAKLRSVAIPDGVTIIRESVFSNCSGLQSVSIPESVTEINTNAFSRCSALRSVAIPESVTKIGAIAFRGCSRLQSIIIPGGVTKIDYEAFADCSGLQSVVLSEGIKTIDTFAFNGCRSLKSLIVPDSVTKIGHYAFCGCTDLQSVTLSKSLNEIDENVFSGCTGLVSIAIPDGVATIGYHAFYECSGLKSVTIPDSITEIGCGAFIRCSSLKSVTIPDSVTEINDYTFYKCTSLQSLRMSENTAIIKCHAFDGCSGLRTVSIPDSVTEIGSKAFRKCPGLQSIIIPNGITEIQEGTFTGCSGLQSVTLPDSVTKIWPYAFGYCSSIRSITIPPDTVIFSANVFKNCSGSLSVIFRGTDIAPFININGYGIDTFHIIKTLMEHRIILSGHTVRCGIEMAHRGTLDLWLREYPVFGEMRLSAAAKNINDEDMTALERLFLAQSRTGYCVPKILNELAATAHACQIPVGRIAETFDIVYIKKLIREHIPIVPAEACRCYYNRSICDMLIRKNKAFIVAEAIALYNGTQQKEYYRHLMEFILSHADTRTSDLLYAVDHAAEIPMEAGTTLAKVRQHRTYTENLEEVTLIEEKYGKLVPGFRLSDYPCCLKKTDAACNGMTARILDLSDSRDIALAARLGELTNCCQRLESAGETAMMHGFLNPNAGFWVVEDEDGTVKAQAEVWEANNGFLVFDNIEFANTDDRHAKKRMEQFRGIIAAWAAESGYQNIIMGCGYNEMDFRLMERAPVPKICITPEELFVLQQDRDTDISFTGTDEAKEYMQTPGYNPNDFVYTDTDEQCVYIKKNGAVSDYLMQGYKTPRSKDSRLLRHTTKEQRNNGII